MVRFSLILFVLRLSKSMVNCLDFLNFLSIVVWVFWFIELFSCMKCMLVWVRVGLMRERNDVNWLKMMDLIVGCFFCSLCSFLMSVIIFVEELLILRCCSVICGLLLGFLLLRLLLWWIILNKFWLLIGLWYWKYFGNLFLFVWYWI